MRVNTSIYIDDSWSGNGQVFTLAGYLAPTDAWRSAFEPQWRAMIQRAPRPIIEFKAADCRHRKKSFNGWSRSDADAITREAVAVITGAVPTTDMVGYSASVAVPGPVRHDHRRKWEEAGFMVAATWVLYRGLDLAFEVTSDGDTVNLFVDEKASFSKLLRDALDMVVTKLSAALPTRNVQPHLSCKSHEHAGLQAADLLAYETAHEALHRMRGDERPVSRALRALTEKRHHQANCIWYNDLTHRLQIVRAGRPCPIAGELLYRSDFGWRLKDQWPYTAAIEFGYTG